MGCNTSKETATSAEDKEKQENGDVKTENKEEHKSSSAKTVTLSEDKGEKSVEEAATKIQAAFRGHKTRKSMKQAEKNGSGSAAQQKEQEPTEEQLRAEFREDDKELCNAATKIQASFRGHMTRKNVVKEDGGQETTGDAQKGEELDIDLTDPELNKAAVKIQASFRGHMVRKEEDEGK